MSAKFKRRHLLILLSIWLAGAVGDRIWFACDRSVPDWDRAEYLTSALNYWQALQQPQWFSGDWWIDFWQLSTKVPPLAPITAAITQLVVGTGADRATLVNLFFSALLLVSVCGLGLELFSVEVGLWAAGLCQLIPGLYKLRLDFLLDYPLTAVVTLCFWCLTVWRSQGDKGERKGRARTYHTKSKIPNLKFPQSLHSWLWAIAFGISLGMAFLVKQTALFFLFVPIVWTCIEVISQRHGRRICQFAIALLLSVAVFGPWYRTNWLLMLTGGKRATIDSAIAEGDPALNTLDAWTYYWKLLPAHISWVLLLVPIVGLLLFASQNLKFRSASRTTHLSVDQPSTSNLIWVAVFLVGAYLLCSLNINKDNRYAVPYLPVVTLLLAHSMILWRGRWGQQIRWSTVGLAILVVGLSIFPVGGALGSHVASMLSPQGRYYAYMGPEFPHARAIAEIMQTAPKLTSNLGVLPSTPEVNQHNFNYFGALRNFQVYGRQVGIRQQQIVQDGRSLDWFLTKTGDQGSVPGAQAQMVQYVEQSPDFDLPKTWTLPDNSILKLYHRRVPQIEVRVGEQKTEEKQLPLALAQVIVPPAAPPGKPIPVTYEWSGMWQQLHSGIVLMTWKNRDSNQPRDRWIHDRGIGMGTLVQQQKTGEDEPETTSYSVTERLAMMPPADVAAGTYILEATYLNRYTGETYPIAVPPVALKIDPMATATPAPELDLVTQERLLAATLPQGTKALERVFAEVGRINQYDPTQDYLIQTQLAMEYRLEQEPQNLDWAYALTLAQVLQQKVAGAIAAAERVTQLDAQNPYAYAYLAFVHLYNWHGAAAQTALKPALALDSNIPELYALRGIAALMQGNIVRAWQDYSTYSKREREARFQGQSRA